MKSVDLLIYVEDPGAANIVADLPLALPRRSVRLMAGDRAAAHLRAAGTDFEEWPGGVNPRDLLEECRPRLFLTGTAENLDQPGFALVHEARRLGIVTAGVVDAPMNAMYRFRGRSDESLTHAPDWILVPDETTRRNFADLGHPAARIKVCGNPHHDSIRRTAESLSALDRSAQVRKLLPGAPPDRKTILFASEISGGLNPLQYRRSGDYTLDGRGAQDGRTEIVMEEFLDAAALLPARPWTLLRIHPKNTPDDFHSLLQEFDGVSQGGSALEWIHLSDLVVGMTSTLLVEALLMDRPVLSIVPRAEERDWFPAEVAGLIPCVSTREELRRQLPGLLEGEGRPDPARLEEACPRGALERTARFLESLLE